VESNIDDVLQISNIFVNVSKGEVAKTKDLTNAFGTSDIHEIVKEILKKGELQVGEKEREHDITSLKKELATLVAEKCVDSSTQRPYSVGMIERAMAEAGYSIKTNRTAKSQVSECIKSLQTSLNLPIERARMRVRITVPTMDGERLREQILKGAQVEDEETGQAEWSVVMLIDPGQFRVINELLQKECKGKGKLETLTFTATAQTG